MNGVDASIAMNGLTLNGARLASSCPPETLHSLLGKPTRVVEAGSPAPAGHRSGQIHFYDDLGIYLNEHHYTFQIQEVVFVLSVEESPFRPAVAIHGELLVADCRSRLGSASPSC